VYFILTDQNASGCPAVWCELEQESYFNEYNIEGVSQEQNEIFLEFIPDKVAKTLTVLKNGLIKSLKMKLTKKNNVPCLTFEVENERVAVHDVPVAVLPRKVWGEYKEPPMPPFDVSICLPELKKLRHLMERFKTLGQAVTITAGKQGKLSLKVESDEGVFSTHYPDLRVPVYRDDTLPWRRPDSQAVTDPDFSASVRVDLKRLGLFLAGEQLQPKRAIANIVENEVLHMFFVHDDLLVQYFLPATSKM
jgi:HUS1 checkpoint protein